MNQTNGLSEYNVIWSETHRVYCIVNSHLLNEWFQSECHSNILSYQSKTSVITDAVPDHYRNE